MTNRNKPLDQRIEESVEQLVREHLALIEEAATEAVRRGVRRAVGTPSARRRKAETGQRRARRCPEEMAAVEEELYRAICAQPGEGMAVLAETVKSTPRKLNQPMRRLRDAGRIRSVGRKQRARYFPTGA